MRRHTRLHPAAWWLWALGLTVTASRTTNPILLGLIVAVVALVVATCRTDTPWGRSFRTYLLVGGWIVALRVVFRIVFGGGFGEHVIFSLPQLPLPESVGFTIGGPVTLEALVAALFDGLRLATILICVGAANALADPKRLLRLVPKALHDVATAVVVALSLVPQLFMASARIRRAQRLRAARPTRRGRLRALAVPVLEEALDRSITLAAAMESRGYGRGVRRRAGASWLLVAGVICLPLGLYGLLGTAPSGLSWLALGTGVVAGGGGVALAGRGVVRSRYRPDPWATPEWTVAISGLLAPAASLATARLHPEVLFPPVQPLAWPQTPWLVAAAVLLASAPMLIGLRPSSHAHPEVIGDPV